MTIPRYLYLENNGGDLIPCPSRVKVMCVGLVLKGESLKWWTPSTSCEVYRASVAFGIVMIPEENLVLVLQL